MANSDTGESSSNEQLAEIIDKKKMPPPKGGKKTRSCRVLKVRSKSADADRTNHNKEMTVSSTHFSINFGNTYLLIPNFSLCNRSKINQQQQ